MYGKVCSRDGPEDMFQVGRGAVASRISIWQSQDELFEGSAIETEAMSAFLGVGVEWCSPASPMDTFLFFIQHPPLL